MINNKVKYKQFAVLGLGRFGQAVVKTLAEHGCDVMCCDKNMEAVNDVEQYATDAFQMDISNSKAISTIGLSNYDCVIIGVGESFEATIMSAMYAKEAGVPMVIAKAKNNEQKALLEKIGVDKVVMPERDTGIRMAYNLISSNIVEYIRFSDKYGIAEINPRKEWCNKNLIESNIRADYGITIMAIKRGEEVFVSPAPATIIRENDILVVIGENDKIQGSI
ncbi:MAG: potassium channel family protein [Lachnospirales bacterium]